MFGYGYGGVKFYTLPIYKSNASRNLELETSHERGLTYAAGSQIPVITLDG